MSAVKCSLTSRCRQVVSLQVIDNFDINFLHITKKEVLNLCGCVEIFLNIKSLTFSCEKVLTNQLNLFLGNLLGV